MNYSNWIIGLGIINLVTIFSGFPTGSKKIIIIISTLILVFIGLVLRAIAKKKQARIKKEKQTIEETFEPIIDQVITEAVTDAELQVEEELAEITHTDSQRNYYDTEERI